MPVSAPLAEVVAVTGLALAAAVALTFVMLLVGAVLAAALDGVLTAGVDGAPRVRAAATPVTESTRLLLQRRRSTVAADRLLWRIASAGLVIVPLLMVAAIPMGSGVLFDSAVGVVWFNTADIFVWALVWLLGWGANSVYGLVGGYRFLAQALAYELPLMFALTAPAVAAGSLQVRVIVEAQRDVWFVVWMPMAFLAVCVGVVGFSVWGPLGPAAGLDVAGGVLAELSGPDRLLVLAGRYLLLVAGSAFTAAVFLGGGAGPWLPSPAWMALKTVALLAVLVWVRRWLPLLRPDRFMEVGWMVLLPVTLLQVLVVALIAVGRR